MRIEHARRVFFMGCVLVQLLCVADSAALAREETAGSASRSAQLVVGELEGKRRIALVIGNGAYRRISPLRNPAHDARDVAASLEMLQFSASCHVDVAARVQFRQVPMTSKSQVQHAITASVEHQAFHPELDVPGIFHWPRCHVLAIDLDSTIPTTLLERQPGSEVVA